MVTIIKYQDIKNLKPLEAVTHLRNKKKGSLDELKPLDLLKGDVLEKKFVDQYYNWLFIRGVYLFFTPKEEEIIYVGMAKDGFYGRFMGHITTTFKANFGWNAILRKMGSKRLGYIDHNQLNSREHEKDLKELLHHKLILIDVGYYALDDINNCLTTQQIRWLESSLLRAFNYRNGSQLLNKRFGNINVDEINLKVEDLLRVPVLEIFLFIANKYKLIDVFSDDYLAKISFYSLDAKRITLVHGKKKPIFEKHLEKELHRNLLGVYSCDKKNHEGEPNSILLGIKDTLLPNSNEAEPSELCEMIALHEICHYIDWQNLKDELLISLSDHDKAIGVKLQKQAQKEADLNGEQDVDHNENFGAILYNLIRKQFPNDASNKMFIALSKTLCEVEDSTFWVC